MPHSQRLTSKKIFIGDIHGQSGKLDALMSHIDSQDDAMMIFLGDLIDNQPGTHIDHLAVLNHVKARVDAGRAICLMGNHEFNAVGWAMRHQKTGLPLRPHTANNDRQHQAFLEDVTENSPQHAAWIDWFKTLPLFIDFGDIRAIHACWDEAALVQLRPWLDDQNRLKPESWQYAFDKQHELYGLLETVLKGPEITLPEGYSFLDKTGIERRNIRVRWWLDDATTWRQLAQVQPDVVECIPDIPLARSYPALTGAPVVVGHYTLAGEPAVLSQSVICVDYNAAKAEHPLVAWQYDSATGDVMAGQFIYSIDPFSV